MALPFATQLLADFGAEVISVEAVELRGDAGIPWRDRTGRHKKRIKAKLDDPRGQDLLRSMVANFDVFGENFRPGVLDRYRLGYKDLHSLNEGLVYVSVSGSGYGHPDFLKSPWWQMAAYGPIGEAMRGSLHAIRRQGGAGSGFALGDMTSALFSTIGILVALRDRDRTGGGQYLDVAMTNSLFALAELPFVNHTLSPQRHGADEVPAPGFVAEAFAVADGEFQINVLSETHWAALCTLLGEPSWASAPRYVDTATRAESIRLELVPLLLSWAATQSKTDVANACRAAAPSRRAHQRTGRYPRRSALRGTADDRHRQARRRLATSGCR